MNILLVSQCDKRALTETRRILDQFAERRGDRTWQTAITKDGLETLRKLLRKSARKNTAVSCHWIRGLDHSELLWTVGDASQFNSLGATPTNTTARNILRREDENDWHTGQDIHLLTTLAALLHDLGKACLAFQLRLQGKLQERNQYRHEWISLRLFEAFVGKDDDCAWLARLENPTAHDDASWLQRLKKDGIDPSLSLPFENMSHAPLAQAVGWLVLTHHRLPVAPREQNGDPAVIQMAKLNKVLTQIDARWNEENADNASGMLGRYWEFPHGLPVTTPLWRKRASRTAKNLLNFCSGSEKADWLDNPYVMHLSRLCLMLADHHYSSLTKDGDPGRVAGTEGYPLYANTKDGGRQFNQALDEHLLGVARHAAETTLALPKFATHLPRLARHKGLRKRSTEEQYRWQDKAADCAAGMRVRSHREGAFVVNMASTGCGKTLANARIMYALADPESGMRCSFAMGLRTLTLQTGQAFRDMLGLGDDELAIHVGGAASKALFAHYEEQAEATGSASRQDLLDESAYVRFEGNPEASPLLKRIMSNSRAASLLSAPLLVCTVDHLTPATESERGGRQVAPMLRLMSGDLVLDEPDDFDIDDLPALTRLVNWAGLLGTRILLSSATLPPALVLGLFDAYRAGRRQFNLNRGERRAASGEDSKICCAWFDEFRQSQVDCTDSALFERTHEEFVLRRKESLSSAEVRRRGQLLPFENLGGAAKDQKREAVATLMRDAALALHASHHTIDPESQKRVSFGLIRMANIEPLVDVALALYRLGVVSGSRIHLCTYHSQYPLLLRSAIERQLDLALNRRWPDKSLPEPVFQLPAIRALLDQCDEMDQLFIVLGSPVTEVGRDHDYDWAVVEPSSMRSLIQLAGRIRRHRSGACEKPNMSILSTNLRHVDAPGRPAFCRPGFESTAHPLDSHFLSDLVAQDELQAIDAGPRILAKSEPDLRPRSRLVDLEHVRMRETMLVNAGLAPVGTNAVRRRGFTPVGGTKVLNASSWWDLPSSDSTLTALLQTKQPFRKNSVPEEDLFLSPAEDEETFVLVQLIDKAGGRHGEKTLMQIDKKLQRLTDDDVSGQGISPWGVVDYMQALSSLAREMDMPLEDCAKKFGRMQLHPSERGWRFHPAIGFSKSR